MVFFDPLDRPAFLLEMSNGPAVIWMTVHASCEVVHLTIDKVVLHMASIYHYYVTPKLVKSFPTVLITTFHCHLSGRG